MGFREARAWASAGWARTWALALLLPCLSLALRLLLVPRFTGLPFLTFLPALVVVTCLCGLRPGLTSALLSGVLAWRFLFPPTSQWGFPWSSSTETLVLYTIVSALLVWLIDSMVRAYEGMKRSESEREALLATLERQVEARTAELTAANEHLRQEIDSRKLAEDKVAQYQRLEAVGQLVGGISHDFNNLLSIVIGNLDLAQRRLARGDQGIGQHIEAAYDGARRGANLTRRLLAFARKQPLQPAVTDLNALIDGMADLLRTTLGEHVTLKLDLAPGLWPSRIDPSQLENAVLNLAVNARDAMPSGGQLTIASRNAAINDTEAELSPGDYVTIAVSDTGHGMSEAVLAKAFEPFFTTKTVGQGTGLGLSQIHGYLKQSGGHAAIASQEGKGTSVTLYLPRHAGSEDIDVAIMPSSVPTDRSAGRVLVVEDEDGVRAVAVQFLEDLDFRVTQAPNGPAALDLLSRDGDIDILFTDVVMPGMMGSELAEKARALRPGLKVLYTTGYTYDAVVKNGQLAPGVEMLQKPFTPEQLADKMQAVLRAG